MATGFKPTVAQSILNAVVNNTTWTAGVTTLYVKLHISDPGVAAANGAATETTRQAATFGVASATTGVVTNDGAVTWTNIQGTQDATHFSVWDDPTAGNLLWTGVIVANGYTVGDTYTFDIGSFSLALTIAA